MDAHPTSDDRRDVALLSTRAQVLGYAVIAIAVLIGETRRWLDPEQRAQSLTTWLCGASADWLPFIPWLLVAPILWRVRGARRDPAAATSPALPPVATRSRRGAGVATACSCLAAAVSLAMSLWVASRFDGWPPAYHDEFSYLFQAETFLAGRTWFPSFAPMPELFDQMHVLNEGRFASRYFPGTGLWLAPFVWLGNPWAGQWTAGALVAAIVCQIGCEVGGNRVGLLAGLLTALAPGMALFSNLLLAHHATLVGLSLCVWMYLRAWRTGHAGCALVASAGLAFAMLCRPMTAFGIGLPFGACFAWWLVTGRGGFPRRDFRTDLERDSATLGTPLRRTAARRLVLAVAMGGPLVLGLGLMGAYNRSITGSAVVSPYQLFTEIYTPRHAFGFDNVVRAEQHPGPKVIDNYDRWAENLTPGLAGRNVMRRLANSGRWSLGIVPLALAAVALLLSRGGSIPVRLIALAIVSLQAVHIPYWFEGMLGWHYVFESGPLWLILCGEGTRRLVRSWRRDGRRAMPLWWSGLIATAVAVNLIPLAPLWPGRMEEGLAQAAFARRRYAEFERAVAEVTGGARSIVFVEPDLSEVHIDYVTNDPALARRVLFARVVPGQTDLDGARQLFPDREAFLFRAATREWSRLP